jgi:hypothetical protein
LKSRGKASGIFTPTHTFTTRRYHETSWNDNDRRTGSRLLKMMKIVTGYKCNQRGEYVQFAGDHETAWYPLDSFEILSMED